MRAAANLHRASSVILLRPARPQGFEVFLACRSDDSPYLGKEYCFSGGPVHKSDHTQSILRRCRGLSGEKARKILGAHLAPPEALGFWIAAIRTLFEELGVLLAVKENGEPPTWDAELQIQRLDRRAAFRDGSLTFQSFLETENLFCDAAALAYFSHWQTPAENSRSSDTRFFLAAMPEPRPLLDTASEITRSRWLAPDRALQLFNRGELPMTFPTFASLRTLADFGSVKNVIKEYQPEIPD